MYSSKWECKAETRNGEKFRLFCIEFFKGMKNERLIVTTAPFPVVDFSVFSTNLNNDVLPSLPNTLTTFGFAVLFCYWQNRRHRPYLTRKVTVGSTSIIVTFLKN